MITINSVSDSKFLNPEKTVIQALVNNEVLITIEKDNDVYNLYDRCANGEFGEISEEEIFYPADPIEEYRATLKCSPLQAKVLLYQYGLLEDVERLIAESEFIIQLAWKEATVFERNSRIIRAMKYDLTWPDGSEITDEQLDNLFEEARQIAL